MLYGWMEKKRTNSGPLLESTSKHSIYPPKGPEVCMQHHGGV